MASLKAKVIFFVACLCVLAMVVLAIKRSYELNPGITDTKVDKSVADTHTTTKKQTTITETKDKKVTVITEDTDKTKSKKEQETEVVKTVPTSTRQGYNISIDAGIIDWSDKRPLYGLSVNKEVLGPLTLGVWGRTNGSVGLSIGVSF